MEEHREELKTLRGEAEVKRCSTGNLSSSSVQTKFVQSSRVFDTPHQPIRPNRSPPLARFLGPADFAFQCSKTYPTI
eukprot:3530947-Pyramimonas_sp.AAC.1